ncbi:MAG: hypothetical protein ACXVA9_13290, partial [Bdellovibrionales bacterium]
ILAEKSPRLVQRVQRGGACYYLDLYKNSILKNARKVARERPEEMRKADIETEVFNTYTSIGWKPGSSEIEKKYLQEVSRISQETDPIARIKAVYQMVNQYRGVYKDYEWDGLPNPGKTLRKAASTGSGGVCRDFSSLLVWSLNKVARGPAGVAQFSVQTKHIPRHALVTVRLFQQPGVRSDNDKRFGLDPTNYARFNPLPLPDLQSSDEVIDQRHERCEAIRKCMSVLNH